MNTAQKNETLRTLAKLLEHRRQQVIDANAHDLALCPTNDLSLADRLKVNDAKISGMIASLEEVAALADPEGNVLYRRVREDGLIIENRSVPFGTILIIYESRPDVTIEAAATAFKAGNAILLKGGKEARNTNIALVSLWQEALEQNGVDPNVVRYLDISREETQRLIAGDGEKLDLIIPRGGETLIDFVKKNSNVPVIVSGRGNNFLYIDSASDFDMAISVIQNGKQRLSVCNALDKVLISKDLPDLKEKIDTLISRLIEVNIDVYGDAAVHALDTRAKTSETDTMLKEEFLSAKMLLCIVSDIDEAIALINTYSGGHSATIITHDIAAAQKFQNKVDCGAVYHNASTRFTDGGQFGLGAEIAISTQKLHFRGPLGAGQLVTNKWFVTGSGHIRT